MEYTYRSVFNTERMLVGATFSFSSSKTCRTRTALKHTHKTHTSTHNFKELSVQWHSTQFYHLKQLLWKEKHTKHCECNW